MIKTEILNCDILLLKLQEFCPTEKIFVKQLQQQVTHENLTQESLKKGFISVLFRYVILNEQGVHQSFIESKEIIVLCFNYNMCHV